MRCHRSASRAYRRNRPKTPDELLAKAADRWRLDVDECFGQLELLGFHARTMQIRGRNGEWAIAEAAVLDVLMRLAERNDWTTVLTALREDRAQFASDPQFEDDVATAVRRILAAA